MTLQFAGEEFHPDVAGLQMFGQRREFDASAEALVFVDHERDRDAGCPQFAGEGDRFVEFGTIGGAGGDLLVEDPGDAGGGEGVKLGVQRLADSGGAGVTDPHVPARLAPACRAPG